MSWRISTRWLRKMFSVEPTRQMAPRSEHPAARSQRQRLRRRLRRSSTRWHSRPAAVADVDPDRRFDAAQTAKELVDIALRYMYSACVRRRPRRRRCCPVQTKVATTPADGRWSPIGRRWCQGAGASRRTAVGGSCTSTSDSCPRPRPRECPPSGARSPRWSRPIDRIRQRGRTMTSFPAEVRCTRMPCPVGEIYRCLATSRRARRGRRRRVRCRKTARSGPWTAPDRQQLSIAGAPNR